MTPEARAARERKQKIFVAVGGIVLLGLLALQLPKLMGGSSSEATTTTTSTLPGSPATATPGTASTPGTPGAIQVSLVDTDRPLPHSPEKLHSFSGFRAKDPFLQQVVQPEPEPVRTEPARPRKARVKTPSKDFSAGQKVRAAQVTVISVNGVRHALEPGAKFPAADPVFLLVSVRPGSKTVVVGIPGGKYENGSKTTKLEQGKPLDLVNEKTKSRYRLKLVRAGSKR